MGTLSDTLERRYSNYLKLIELLSRHYSHKKPCGHEFDCTCLQDESLAMLKKIKEADHA